jgi:hypothetical protein
MEIPPILEFPSPLLLRYSRESSIAEKFEAMLKLQSARCALAPPVLHAVEDGIRVNSCL